MLAVGEGSLSFFFSQAGCPVHVLLGRFLNLLRGCADGTYGVLTKRNVLRNRMNQFVFETVKLRTSYSVTAKDYFCKHSLP